MIIKMGTFPKFYLIVKIVSFVSNQNEIPSFKFLSPFHEIFVQKNPYSNNF